ncbi:MAG: hypothetical protein EOP20_13830 [Hyphomicrobiales bacterium]|nr:MAG: hypothetical protein EOP20_13830 [Hyphomicrobiales bacterium]
MMTTVLIGLVFSLLLSAIAIWANAHFGSEERLPMQWWLDGRVTWTARRRLAVAFIPAISIPILLGFSVFLAYAQPRPGQKDLVVPSLIALGLVFVAVQIFHLWMVDKTARTKGS